MLDYIFQIPKYIWSSLLIVVILLIVCIVIGRKVKKLKIGDKPGKIVTMFIWLVDFLNGYVKTNVGKHWRFVAPVIVALSLLIFTSNISGLFLLDTPTKYTTVTLAFSIVAFVVIQVVGVRSKGPLGHLNTLVGPLPIMSPIMVPLNLVSDFMPLISMTVRLFGNIASGAAMMTLVYSLGQWFSIIIAPPLHLIFDIGFGIIQTIVFVLLTLVFASNKIKESDFN